MSLTLTVIVPAHNEEDGLADTLDSLLHQWSGPDRIIVAADNCTDRTVEVARSYPGVEVVECQGGSKAAAQNIALAHCDTDLVLPVDADTVLAPDYIHLIREPFADPNVAEAAGCVLTKHQNTVWEQGRQMEYLFGFHWYRLIQQRMKSPTVCSGCNTAFRRDMLVAFGGFPERTIVEDIDYCWSQQIAGRQAVYVADAVAFAAEPVDFKYMAKQLWRWKSGYFQNVRQHFFGGGMVTKKPWLALWVLTQLVEIMALPIFFVLPFLWVSMHIPVTELAGMMVASELLTFFAPVLYGCKKRGIKLRMAFRWYPSWWALKILNAYYDWKAGFVELVLVPLGVVEGLHRYEKGRADTEPVLEGAMQ